jgi:peptidoglycan/LPS O-acetylase OafA/YrhL
MPQSFLRTYVLDRYDAGPPRPDRGHIVELDSLRGVAALFVVFDHFLRGWYLASQGHFVGNFAYVPFLANGQSAVMLFFVLSGFVLTLPMLSAKPQSYPAYAVRRICRIYLPYLAALMVALFACWRVRSLNRYGLVMGTLWQAPPSWHLVAKHLEFLGRYDVYAYNPPTWSLVHEMRISLIFPLLCLIALRLRPWAAFAIAVSFPVAGRLVEKYSAPMWEPGTSSLFWSETIGFCGIFLVGSLLARYRQPIVAWLAALPRIARWALIAVAVVLYQYSALLHVPRALRNFTVGLAAAYFVMLALVPNGWLSRLLRRGPPRFLGRVSYSLYLIHSPILIVMSIAIWGKMPYIYLLPPFLAVALLAAAGFHRFVEMPSIALGKAITAKWRGPAKVEAVIGPVREKVA